MISRRASNTLRLATHLHRPTCVQSLSSVQRSTNGLSFYPLLSLCKHRIIGTRGINTQIPRPYVDPRLSYAFGRSNDTLVYSTVGRQFAKAVETRPDDVAFVFHFENKIVTLQQLHDDVNKLVKALLNNFGISKGDFVGIFAYNCYNWLVVQYACLQIGAILTPINPSYKPAELSFILEKGKIKCLFMPGPKSVQASLNNHLEVLQSEQIMALDAVKGIQLRDIVLLDSENRYNIKRSGQTSRPGSLDLSSFDLEAKLANCQFHNWADLDNDGLVFKSAYEAEQAGYEQENACIYDFDQVSPDDLFAIYYTSGTTGKPKGACVSQFTAFNNAFIAQRRIRNGRPGSYRIICGLTLPMFHIFAGVLNMLAPIICNTTLVFAGPQYDLRAYVDSMIKHQANLTTVTPTMLIDMLTYIETNKLQTQITLKSIQSGGAALSSEVADRAFKVLPQLEEIKTGYGSTENGGVSTMQTIHEPAETRPFTVGAPIDFSEVRIVKPNTDDVLPLGERGEIETRGFNTMVEYLGQPDKTAEVLSQSRWYKTGDVGFMHPHGSIQICGRLKHMIIKGGENIYPEEVSQLIYQLECVEDVHVVGVPDERFGEQVCAWIKLKPGYREAREGEVMDQAGTDGLRAVTKDAILKHCKENITYFKVPKYILFVKEYPMTPTKKVQNHIMTEMSCEILGLKYRSV